MSVTDVDLNELERQALELEEQVEELQRAVNAIRWRQAQEVVRRLDAGETQKQVADSWVNLRTRRPYSQTHVSYVARVWRKWAWEAPDKSALLSEPPSWPEAYEAVANGNHAAAQPARAEPHVRAVSASAIPELAQPPRRQQPPSEEDLLPPRPESASDRAGHVDGVSGRVEAAEAAPARTPEPVPQREPGGGAPRATKDRCVANAAFELDVAEGCLGAAGEWLAEALEAPERFNHDFKEDFDKVTSSLDKIHELLGQVVYPAYGKLKAEVKPKPEAA